VDSQLNLRPVGDLSLANILSGANAFEISDIQENETWGSANQAIAM
jgi:hypothetical protein